MNHHQIVHHDFLFYEIKNQDYWKICKKKEHNIYICMYSNSILMLINIFSYLFFDGILKDIQLLNHHQIVHHDFLFYEIKNQDYWKMCIYIYSLYTICKKKMLKNIFSYFSFEFWLSKNLIKRYPVIDSTILRD